MSSFGAGFLRHLFAKFAVLAAVAGACATTSGRTQAATPDWATRSSAFAPAEALCPNSAPFEHVPGRLSDRLRIAQKAGLEPDPIAGMPINATLGGYQYRKVDKEPSHPGKKLLVADGGGASWYELDEPEIAPEMFGAAGDGSANDDAAELQARSTAAVLNRPVKYARTYRITSRMDRPQVLAVGPGFLTDGVETWRPAQAHLPATASHSTSSQATMIDDGAYSHFPSFTTLPSGDIVGVYYRGTNHGQADEEAIVSRHQIVAAGDVPINGNMASRNAVQFPGRSPIGSPVRLTTTAFEDGINIKVAGESNGVQSTETIKLTKGFAVGRTHFTSIDSVTADRASNGLISVGFYFVPSDTVLVRSSDGGRTFRKQTIGDGTGSGRLRYYSTSLTQNRTGKGIVLMQKWELGTPISYVVRESLDGFHTFGAERPVKLDTEVKGTFYFYGDIKSGPSGEFTSSGFTRNSLYFLHSRDGVHWASSLIGHSGNVTRSETAIEALGPHTMIAVARLDRTVSSLEMFRSLDAGRTWSVMGQTNLPVGGGYVSPQLGLLRSSGSPEAVLIASERQTARGSKHPNSILARFAPVDRILESSLNWSRESVVIANFAPPAWRPNVRIERDDFRLAADGQTYRSLLTHISNASNAPGLPGRHWARFNSRGGYPSVHIDGKSGRGWMVYGAETGVRKSHLIFKRIDWANVRQLAR